VPRSVAAAFLIACAAVVGAPGHAFASGPLPGPYLDGRRTVVPTALAAALGDVADARAHANIPSFSRQTKLACNACHYQFLQLTPFGRRFKLNGYTLTGRENIVARDPRDSTSETLRLASIPPVSAMAIASFSRTRSTVPGTQNGSTTFPDQLSLFLGGAVTPKVGLFAQLTYAAPDAAVGIDNVDLRFADRTTLASRELVYGVTLNNNPTVQDVWNTVPAWSFPFISSPVAPSPSASPLVAGTLGQQVLGLGAYGLWNDLLYAELTAYRSAPQGGAQPADSSATNTVRAVAPYWRVALQRQLGSTYVMVGTYGLSGRLFPAGVSGLTNRYSDVAADAQLEHPTEHRGVFLARSSLIRESQHLDASVGAEEPLAEHRSNTLTTFRINGSYQPTERYGLTLGYFDVRGTRDALLYAPGAVTGSATGRPNSSGIVGELDVNAWQNLRIGAQYVAYGTFNGRSRSYDGEGRNAAGNDALYTFVWLAF
jgi:hypothetical protein